MANMTHSTPKIKAIFHADLHLNTSSGRNLEEQVKLALRHTTKLQDREGLSSANIGRAGMETAGGSGGNSDNGTGHIAHHQTGQCTSVTPKTRGVGQLPRPADIHDGGSAIKQT